MLDMTFTDYIGVCRQYLQQLNKECLNFKMPNCKIILHGFCFDKDTVSRIYLALRSLNSVFFIASKRKVQLCRLKLFKLWTNISYNDNPDRDSL